MRAQGGQRKQRNLSAERSRKGYQMLREKQGWQMTQPHERELLLIFLFQSYPRGPQLC